VMLFDSQFATKAPDNDNSVRVYVRIRPPNERESQSGALVANCESKSITVKETSKTFTFDHVADSSSGQQDVFDKVGKPITDTCLAGYNGTIFAYGQTGTGKTHTIQGATHLGPDNQGLMPRVFDYMCQQIAEEQKKSDVVFECHGSFLEIYNEKIYDLLTPSTGSLNMREDVVKGVFVEGLSNERFLNAEGAMAIMRKGISNRTVAETAMNRCSSRSHCVFTISIHSTKSMDGVSREKRSLFHLIDLAGSERQKDTKATGEQLKEASQINKSLSALGNVIMSLVDTALGCRKRHVHYRDSKLTFLLKDSLGGNSLTCIVACCSPSSDSVQETISTLQFAARAKFIQNRAVVNEDTSGTVAALQDTVAAQVQELARLKAELSRTQAMNNAPRTPLRGVLQQTLIQSRREDGMLSDRQLLEGALKQNEVLQHTIEKMRLDADASKSEIVALKELAGKFEKQHQSDKFVLRLRDMGLKRLEVRYQSHIGDNEVFQTLQEMNHRLQEERDQYRHQLDFNPEIVQRTVTIRELQRKLFDMEKNQKESPVRQELIVFEQHALTKTIVELKGRLEELQEKVRHPDILYQALSTPQKRKFDTFELEKWKQEQKFETRLQEVEGLLESEQTAHLEAVERLEESQSTIQQLMLEIKRAQIQTQEAKDMACAQAAASDQELRTMLANSMADLSKVKQACASAEAIVNERFR